MYYIRVSALVFGVFGLLLFGAALIASFAAPGFVEQAAREVIRFEVERQVHEKIERLDNSFLGRQAAKLSGKYAERVSDDKQRVERINQVINEMRDPQCECRRKIAGFFRDGLNDDIASSNEAQAQLTAFVRAKYMDTAEHVTREFRIFTGTNAAVFALLVVAVRVRGGAGVHLLPATVILMISATLTSYMYLFNQDWLHTLLFNEYVGYGYIGWLGAVFALLFDIVFNRARVTVQMLNLALSAVGSVLSVASC